MQAGLSWPLPGELTDDALKHRLFVRAGVKQGQRRRKEPNWAELSVELKKPGVKLLILWEEYRSVHSDGYGYSRFYELFCSFEQRLSPRSSIAVNASPCNSADMAARAMERTPRTCRARTGAMPSGRRIASGAGARPSVRRPRADLRHSRQPATPRARPQSMPRHPAPLSRHQPRLRRGRFGAVEIAGLTCKTIASLIAPTRAQGIPPNLLPSWSTPICVTPATFGLKGMASAYQELEMQTEARSLEHGEWLALFLEREVTTRRQKRFEARARAAQIENIDFRAARRLDRYLFMKLAAYDWIRERHSLLSIGPAGVGKSWLACALGHKACREDFSVAYHHLPRFFATLALARGDGRYPKVLKALARTDLLILDDWGRRSSTTSSGAISSRTSTRSDPRQQPGDRRSLV
ncbi:Mobile element protein (plasmid) [Sinorhizobium sojae CCBAU 05684]|uniref:Mobile element protein n=1 Tax=Sinorhizobium sojae CCBAU 05684 TaxID=716928 RepID=A0A249PJ84_9HYPH|nr:Mobile element protein [Sinorhizobium sojae CCBAU 05684]